MHDPHQEFFDRLAQEWDLHFTAEDLERLKHLVDKLPVKTGMQILDLGCGTGVLFDMLRRKVGDKGSVIGIDFSLQMARTAHRNFPFDNVFVVDADVTHLPLADAQFDLAVAFASFPHFSNQQNALAEAFRVLRPKGRIYIIHLQSSKELMQQHHRVGGVVAEDALPNPDQFTIMFGRAGFHDVEIDDHPSLFVASAKKPA